MKKAGNKRHNSYSACVGRQLKETWQKSLVRSSIHWSLVTVTVIFICKGRCREKSFKESCIGQVVTLCRTSTRYLEGSWVWFYFLLNSALWAGLRTTIAICLTEGLKQGPVFQFLRLRPLHRSASGWVRSSIWAPKLYMDPTGKRIARLPSWHGTDWERLRKIPALTGKSVYNVYWAHTTPKLFEFDKYSKI